MKFFMMLIVLLSMFFIISCGDSDSTEGMSEADFYNKSAVQLCEKGFECNNEIAKQQQTSVDGCSTVTAALSCEGGQMSYDGSQSQECIDCASALSCDQFFTGGFPSFTTDCPSCKTVCVPK